MSKLNEEIINETIEKIKMLSDDVEVRMVELVDHKDRDSIELMEITMEIFRKCEEVGIKLEFRNIGVVGLPFVIPFKKAKC